MLARIAALESRLYQLRYEKALRDHPGLCNCAALVVVDHHDRRPSSLRLIETVVELYAYEWRCEACGMRWWRTATATTSRSVRGGIALILPAEV